MHCSGSRREIDADEAYCRENATITVATASQFVAMLERHAVQYRCEGGFSLPDAPLGKGGVFAHPRAFAAPPPSGRIATDPDGGTPTVIHHHPTGRHSPSSGMTGSGPASALPCFQLRQS